MYMKVAVAGEALGDGAVSRGRPASPPFLVSVAHMFVLETCGMLTGTFSFHFHK